MKASEVAELTGGVLVGPDRGFEGVAPLGRAGPRDLAFAERTPATPVRAGVLLATRPATATTVVVARPREAFVLVLQHLFPEIHPQGVQPGAWVHPTARLGRRTCVYPGAYVGPDVEIGDDSVVYPNAVVLAGSRIGRGCVVGPGAVVGHAGFGLHATPEGPRPVPQVGRAVLEDGVSLGANTCVDRAFLEETRVGAGTQIDNLVQVGHNCKLGRNVVVAGQAGLSGSVHVGDGAVLGGQVGIADHVTVGPGARIGGQSGVHRDLSGPASWLGTPAVPATLAGRVFAAWKHLPDLVRRVRRIEERLEALAERGQTPGRGGPPDERR
ncbi:MAG: UDP-3-O-(3-hydroxymyristoyl)glucosamine N-acyltransferase [Deltaproteobacteria bacterium]|nr:UDP-3-O-(3-hydroxymyristoyl)glucosamine N-acyltransferase [Deltaproteobacteria bacterium]